ALGKPLPPAAPTIYPGNVGGYAPTQPAPPVVQPRKTGFPCLTATVISVVLLLIVIGSVLVLPQISHLWLPAALSPPLTVAPTSVSTTAPTIVPTPTTVPTPTPTTGPTGLVTENQAEALMKDFCFYLRLPPGAKQEAFNLLSRGYQRLYLS